MQAYGEADELCAALGLARALGLGAQVEGAVDGVQARLVGLMGELATLPGDMAEYCRRGYARIGGEDVAWVEEQAAAMEQQGGIRFEGWARPGQGATPGAAALDLARAVCRRVERAALALHAEEPLENAFVLVFLNRLSDLLWLAARYETKNPA